VLSYFSDSDHRLLSRKTDLEWKKKSPEIKVNRFTTLLQYSGDGPGRKSNLDIYSNVISSQEHVFISKRGWSPKIFVIDGETLNVCHTLEVQFNKDEPAFCAYNIKMVTDENFLVAWVWNWER
jgi:hypothetical protein